MKYFLTGDDTCHNLQTWCEAAKPDCEQIFVKEQCKKYCGLCPGTLFTFLKILYIFMDYKICLRFLPPSIKMNSTIYFPVCKNKASWCDAAKPDCSTEIAKENCQKFCGKC